MAISRNIGEFGDFGSVRESLRNSKTLTVRLLLSTAIFFSISVITRIVFVLVTFEATLYRVNYRSSLSPNR